MFQFLEAKKQIQIQERKYYIYIYILNLSFIYSGGLITAMTIVCFAGIPWQACKAASLLAKGTWTPAGAVLPSGAKKILSGEACEALARKKW